MENRTILLAFLAVWAPYLIAVHGYAFHKRLNHWLVLLSHALPTLVAVSMTGIFLIGHGATVRQFVAYSEKGMNLWSLWFDLWPLLVLGSLGSAIAAFVAAIVVALKPKIRNWFPVALTACGMSIFAMMTAGANFPDA